MKNEQWFDYITNTFDEEHNLVRIILIGEDNAIRILQKENYEADVYTDEVQNDN